MASRHLATSRETRLRCIAASPDCLTEQSCCPKMHITRKGSGSEQRRAFFSPRDVKFVDQCRQGIRWVFQANLLEDPIQCEFAACQPSFGNFPGHFPSHSSKFMRGKDKNNDSITPGWRQEEHF